MGYGRKDEENPVSEDEIEAEAEKKRLNTPEGEEMEMKKIPVKTRDGAYPEVIVGQSDPLIKAHHLKYLLLGFNLFLTILGLTLLAISIWIRVDPEFWEYETTLDVDNFHTVCIMFIVASIFILIVGFVGCFGAATERRWLLIMYIVIFGFVFLLQLGALVLMWSAPYSKTITKELEKQIQNQIESRNTDDSSRNFVDFIQYHLECCGSVSHKDYKGAAVPNSCLSKVDATVYTSGCASKMLTYLRGKAGNGYYTDLTNYSIKKKREGIRIP
ncbi:tetraspanin [Trichonephila inaurata madagascariensis]|uniref:Tetraspanin n=1 Tax=Trichonephila inaurata madagascariensis TaxID=2747483 RepID=A0A8X6MJW7_9ARAC|nr:tetraspanin [Trichonephila inaurata madagascariensis]